MRKDVIACIMRLGCVAVFWVCRMGRCIVVESMNAAGALVLLDLRPETRGEGAIEGLYGGRGVRTQTRFQPLSSRYLPDVTLFFWPPLILLLRHLMCNCKIWAAQA